MFKAQINHTTGKREWVVQDDKFDVTQELARSRFGDMILDHDRNDKFLAGLKTVISEKKAKGQEAIVLDIGAGTGLLSLMAAREGADRVTAIEVFEPMAVCAKKIINNTPYKNKIEVISSRSTDLESLPDKANIIVAEVFDTELNGEGALRTFKEALTNLAQPGCRVVPSSATVWVTPVSSKFLAKFNDVPRFPYFENRRRNAQDKQLETDTSPLGECPGTAAVFDVQLSELNPRKFTALSRPFIAFEFDYENADKIIYNEKFEREAECINSGTVDAIMMWWSLDMDGTGKHIIDMSPSWCNANKQYTWRDHWMQAVYFPPKKVNLNRGEMFKMNCCHDEYSLWFSFGIEESVPRPYCNCRLHSMYSRYSIHGMNRMVNSASYANFGEEMIAGEFIVVVGEGSLFGLTLARFASKVVIIDINPHSREILTKYISYYNLSDKVELLAEISELKEKPFAVVAEPFYLSATNSFQQLRFWHEAHAIRKIFGEDIEIYPKEANIESLPLEFVDLQKTSLPVGTVHGFDLSYFDKISYRARQATDAIIDEYPLWEYDCYDTANIQRIGKLNFLSEPKDTIIKAELDLGRGTNALALWITWNYDSLLKSTGTHDTKPENGDPVVKDDRIICMSSVPTRRITGKLPEFAEDVQDWENHVILRVPDNVADRVNTVLDSNNPVDELAINLTSMDMRQGTVRLGQHLMGAKVYDLPCIIEVQKTIDRKNIFKVADLSQIMICSHDLSQQSTSADPSSEPIAKSFKKEQKQWQHPHGLTPPMKSVRRRRFRKTKKKKYMDAPEVEKELKRLLRADLDADSVRWEIVPVEDKKKDTQIVSDQTIFGEKVTSSEDEDAEPKQLAGEEEEKDE